MGEFDYDRAEADLYDSGCPYSEEIYDYQTEKGRNEFMRENGLDPNKYTNSGSGSSNNNSSGGSICYLTTACVVSKGLPDNCEELTILRGFRDNYLKKIAGGEEEIKEYYQIAPKIVEAINNRIDASSIWAKTYTELILPCVDLIKKNENDIAHKKYKVYTKYLQGLYQGETNT